MDPVLIGGGVAAIFLSTILGLLVRAARKRGQAEQEAEEETERRDWIARLLHELARGRARGRDLLDRLQNMGRK